MVALCNQCGSEIPRENIIDLDAKVGNCPVCGEIVPFETDLRDLNMDQMRALDGKPIGLIGGGIFLVLVIIIIVLRVIRLLM